MLAAAQSHPVVVPGIPLPLEGCPAETGGYCNRIVALLDKLCMIFKDFRNRNVMHLR